VISSSSSPFVKEADTLTTENSRKAVMHEIGLYMPGKPLLLVVVFGSLLALLGVLLVLTSSGMWVQLFAGSLALGLAVIVFCYFVWLWRNPVFLVNTEGVRTRYLALHIRVAWEEIAAILSAPGGLLIRKRPEASGPQEIFVLQGSLPISAEQLVLQLQHQFRHQLEQYGILVRSERESEENQLAKPHADDGLDATQDMEAQ
jgi:hypothetical protein